MGRDKSSASSRRNFLKRFGAGMGAVSIAGSSLMASGNPSGSGSGEKVRLLSPDGKLVEVDRDAISLPDLKPVDLREKARTGIPNRKFAMVVDLSRCGNARKCIEACQEGHMLSKDHEWIKLYLLQDSEKGSPYWLPRPCFHCDNPLCVSVCPVGATYKREDGIVLVDSERCIGCKFCMTACPYSARVFQWKDPEVEVPEGTEYDPELNIPPVEGTVSKCVFCADLLRENRLPRCVEACPMGALYFGDLVEDTIANKDETLRFSKVMTDKHGYRFMEELGTHPSVYYLPPTDRMFPYESGLEGLDESVRERYKNTGPRETHRSTGKKKK